MRSHVHYHVFNGGAGWIAFTTPGLQGWTKYGSLACEGTVDVGLISIDITREGWSWKAHLLDMGFAGARPSQA